MFKKICIVLGCLLGVLAILFALELVGVGFFRFFEPMKEDARREVFENTKSYVHGKIQDLAKYYEEYEKAKDPADKEAIKGFVQMNFAKFPAEQVDALKLRSFLIEMRGY